MTANGLRIASAATRESSADSIVDGVINDDIAGGADGVELLEAAIAAAEARGHDEQGWRGSGGHTVRIMIACVLNAGSVRPSMLLFAQYAQDRTERRIRDCWLEDDLQGELGLAGGGGGGGECSG